MPSSSASSNIAGIFGSLLCYGISFMDGVGGLSAWRWFYPLEVIRTIQISGPVWYYLPEFPKSPRSNRWFTESEHEFIDTRLPETVPLTNDPNYSTKDIESVLSKWLIWSFMLSQTLVNLGVYALK